MKKLFSFLIFFLLLSTLADAQIRFRQEQQHASTVYTTSNLSVFTTTTSAQLAEVISNETGSGLLVFGTSPTLTTPILSGTITGTYTLGGTPTITAPTFSGNVAFGTGVVIRKTAETQAVNNSTALVNDDALFVALAANEVVYFIANVFHTGNSTADIKFAFTVPAGATLVWSPTGGVGLGTAGTATTYTPVTASDTTLSFGASTDINIETLTGFVRNSTTAGNLQLRWAQDVATVINTIVKIDSFMVVFRQ